MSQSHHNARKLLARSIANDRLAHAWLFAGPDGAGKRTLAGLFGRALLCERKSMPPCDACPACRRAGAGSHPDMSVIEAEGRNIKIAAVRELVERLQYHSYEGGFKVGIIVEAERLTENAMNAFLKTLEEPPDNTVLVLTTSNMNRILPTIISRCQVLRLGPLSDRAVAELIRAERGLEGDKAELLAGLARGNARRALDMDLDFVVDFRKRLIEKILGLDAENAEELLDFAEDIAKAPYPAEEVLDLVAAFYRDVLHVKLGESDIINSDLEVEAKTEARRNTAEEILQNLEALREARARIMANANPRLNWEILTMSLKRVEGAKMVHR